LPTVGVLSNRPPGSSFDAAWWEGLKQAGFIDGQNVRIDYRWTRGGYEQLLTLAAELVAKRVAVIAAVGTAATQAAKAASNKIAPPVSVVFAMGSDPVADGVVASLNNPGGNTTGVTSIAASLAPKRIELAHLLVRKSRIIALLINPDNALISETERRNAEAAAHNLGLQLDVLTARNISEIEAAFAQIKPRAIGALIIATDANFFVQSQRLAALASQHHVPAVGPLREFAIEGGLVSYGTSIADVNRQAGIYVGRVLKGERPADLPVLQPTKFELVVNLRTAKALGVDVSPTLLATADEVIE
jgi:putative ABC transport system substrate-binding protein